MSPARQKAEVMCGTTPLCYREEMAHKVLTNHHQQVRPCARYHISVLSFKCTMCVLCFQGSRRQDMEAAQNAPSFTFLFNFETLVLRSTPRLSQPETMAKRKAKASQEERPKKKAKVSGPAPSEPLFEIFDGMSRCRAIKIRPMQKMQLIRMD